LSWESTPVDAQILFGRTAAVTLLSCIDSCEPYVRPGLVQPEPTLGDRAL
jgi:hypothetical protein